MAQKPQDYTDMAVMLAGLGAAFLVWGLIRIVLMGLQAAQASG